MKSIRWDWLTLFLVVIALLIAQQWYINWQANLIRKDDSIITKQEEIIQELFKQLGYEYPNIY